MFATLKNLQRMKHHKLNIMIA